jgi:hypothetical protein
MSAAMTLAMLAPHAAVCNPLTSGTCIVKIAAGPVGAAAGAAAAAGGAGAAARAAGGAAASAGVSALGSAIQNALATIAKDTLAAWVNIPSPDLATDPVPRLIQQWLFPFSAAVALTGFIVTAARMALTRKAAPLADLGTGLLAMAATTAAATLLPTLLLRAGDAFSSYVLTASTSGKFAQRFTELIAFGATAGPVPAGLMITLGIFAILMAAVQAVLLLFRQGALIVMAGTLPLAAAGQLTPLTRPWLKRQAGWMLALIFYKPAAALVYAAGFALLGNGTSPQDFLMGFSVLALSLIAMPALMRFFTWTTGQVEASAGGGILSAVIGGAAAVGAIRGYGGMSAVTAAQSLTDALGRGDPSGQSPGSGSGPGGGPSGPGGRRPGPGAGTGPGTGGPDPASPGSGPGGSSASGAGPGGRQPPAGAGTAGAASTAGQAARGAATAGAAGPAAGVIMVGQAGKAAGQRLADGATTSPQGWR